MMQTRCVPLSRASSFMLKRNHQAIVIDPSSPWGYEAKHAVLLAAGRYVDAVDTFATMLLKMTQSPDPNIRGE